MRLYNFARGGGLAPQSLFQLIAVLKVSNEYCTAVNSQDYLFQSGPHATRVRIQGVPHRTAIRCSRLRKVCFSMSPGGGSYSVLFQYTVGAPPSTRSLLPAPKPQKVRSARHVYGGWPFTYCFGWPCRPSTPAQYQRDGLARFLVLSLKFPPAKKSASPAGLIALAPARLHR